MKRTALTLYLLLLNILLFLYVPDAWSVERLSNEQMNIPMAQIMQPGNDHPLLVKTIDHGLYINNSDDGIYLYLLQDQDFEIGEHQLVYTWGADGTLCAYNPITGQPIFCENSFMSYEVAAPQYRACGMGPIVTNGYFIKQGDVGCVEVTAEYRKLMHPYQGMIIAESVEPQFPPRPIGQYASRTRVVNAVTTLDEMDIAIKYGKDYLGVVYVQGVIARMNSDTIVETYNEPRKYFGYFLGWGDTK